MRWTCVTVGLLVLLPSPAGAESFRLPLDETCDGGNCLVTVYRDNGGMQDWNCDSKVYRNHSGTDFATLHSFGRCISSIYAVAAAAGRVSAMRDGEEDHCTCRERGCGRGAGNYVTLEHADGSRTTYAHLARSTVQVNVGDVVECGARLGQIGMSGNTTGPHLHFEFRPSAHASSVDVYSGTCSDQQSRWTDQGEYGGLPGQRCAAPSGPIQAATCGDGLCNGAEACETCSADCGLCSSECGDSFCEGGETTTSCSTDCGPSETNCGDGFCDSSESCSSCEVDCGECTPVCGDGTCNSGEQCDSCSTDCGTCSPLCGDGRCEGDEWCGSCETDCGGCAATCGDGVCDWDESCDTCAFDCCGTEGPVCGDGWCDWDEGCFSCAADCGECDDCGDGVCDWDESCESCAFDCCGTEGPVCGDGWCDPGEDCTFCELDCGPCESTCASGHMGYGENGDPCSDASETWKCVYSASWSDWVSQVCRSGEWVTYHISPQDCEACCGTYSSGCSA